MFNAVITQTHIIVKINNYPVIKKAVKAVKKFILKQTFRLIRSFIRRNIPTHK